MGVEPVLNLGCGDDHHADAWNVDAVAACGPDEVYDLTDYPWPERWEGATLIRMYHVLEHLPDMRRALEEAARVLAPGGVLDVRLPMGLDAAADPTHLWGERRIPWTWRTPAFVVGERHWHEDLPLSVVDRDVDVWAAGPDSVVSAWRQLRWRWRLRRHDPGEWCFDLPGSCGEFHVTYRKTEAGES